MSFFVFSIPLLLFALQAHPPPDEKARQIVKDAIAKARFNQEYKTDRLEYKKIVLEYNLDESGNPASIHRNDTYRIFKKGGTVLEQLIEQDGERVYNDEPRPSKSYGDLNPAQLFRETLPQKFDFYFLDEQIEVDGFRSAYALGFRPKPNLLAETELDKIMLDMDGRLYMDEQKNTFRIESRLIKTVTLKLGLIPAKLYVCEFVFQQRKFEGIVVEDFVRIRIKLRIALFFKRYREYNRIFRDYRFEIPHQ